jgi:hypothetical protein
MEFADSRCRQCGFAFAGKVPPQDFLQQYYGDSFSIESTSVNIKPNYNENYRLKVIEEWVKPGGTILEVGANKGEFCQILREHGYVAEGIDPLDRRDEELVQGGFVGGSTNIQQLSDAVVSYYVLEHVIDAREWLSSLSHCLQDNGVLVLEVPNYETHPLAALNHEHLLYFTPYHLHRLLDTCGFSTVMVDPNRASRDFGFTAVAIKAQRPERPKLPVPDTAAIYKRSIEERHQLQARVNNIVDAIEASLGNISGQAKIFFWAANETSSAIAEALHQRRPDLVPGIIDNSSQKQGHLHEGFVQEVKPADGESYRSHHTLFVLCSPSWNNQIRQQIEEMQLADFSVIDTNEY